MRRYIYLTVLMVVALGIYTVAIPDGTIVVRRAPSAPATGNILSELLDSGGFTDADWTTAADSGTVTANNTTGCGTGTGWATQCLFIDAGVFANPQTRNTFAAQSGDVWVRVRTKLVFTIGTDNNRQGVASLSTSGVGAEGNGGYSVNIQRDAGPNYRLKLRIFSAGGTAVLLDSYPAGSLATGDQLCVEFYENITSHAWEWRINGVSEGSGTEATIDTAPTDLYLGAYETINSGEAETLYFDQIEVSSTGWLGCS